MSNPNTAAVMWQAVVFTEGRTPCGISIGQPEPLQELYGTHQEAMTAALAAMQDRPELYCASARRVEVQP